MLVSATPRGAEDSPIRSEEELLEPFRLAEKPPDRWRIGVEAEKFGVDRDSGAPLGYFGERGVVRIFRDLTLNRGWQEEREEPSGPVIALHRSGAAVTLEPGVQFELSGAPQPDVHAVAEELYGHLREIEIISEQMNLFWLGVGFHPTARQADLVWVPKQRYRVMKNYLPTRGSGALDMMRRTATVQANLDYASEADALHKLLTLLRLSPLFHAMTANAPFFEGRLAGKKSVRGEVWLNMDPHRSGLIPELWTLRRPGYRDYAEWALEAGMFLFKRNGQVISNAGQSFRSFLRDGYQGHRATLNDWKLHLNTLFPEVRLKNTIEVRPCDSLPTELACALAALLTGIAYDQAALDAASELMAGLSYEQVQSARPELVRIGLEATIGGTSAQKLAETLIEIAAGGLQRRSRRNADGLDEQVYLKPLVHLVAAGKSPADRLTEGLSNQRENLLREILERTRL
ncbi:MAG TPA: glutamate-cysteine ligase family protein [Polyangiaceae bacterium]|jgi:glutamate--cysteine ligase